jgi:probable phosphoglycerate mutase
MRGREAHSATQKGEGAAFRTIREPGNLPGLSLSSFVRKDGRQPWLLGLFGRSFGGGHFFIRNRMAKKLSAVLKPAFHAHTHWTPEPATRILLIRHGETQWNVRRRIQGWKGTGLNALGRRQAGVVARRVKAMGLNLDAILVSDLKRAVQTAQALARLCRLPLLRAKEWRERCFGDWEGKSIDEVLAGYRLGPEMRRDPFLVFDPKGGESMTVFARRTEMALRNIESRYAGKTVAVVTHGGPMRIAACLATGIPMKKYFLLGRPGNSSLTLIQRQGGVRWLEFYNDTAHLENRS